MKNFYNIIQGDCLEVLPTLEDSFFDFIVTDPPFLAVFGTTADKNDIGNYSIIEGWFSSIAKEFYRVLKPSGKLMLFCDWRSYPSFWRSIMKHNFEQRNLVVWINDAARKYNLFRFCHQFIFVATKPPFTPSAPPGHTFDYHKTK
ncbi:unnamed protein product, partial [marine sediment metagenome]